MGRMREASSANSNASRWRVTPVTSHQDAFVPAATVASNYASGARAQRGRRSSPMAGAWPPKAPTLSRPSAIASCPCPACLCTSIACRRSGAMTTESLRPFRSGTRWRARCLPSRSAPLPARHMVLSCVGASVSSPMREALFMAGQPLRRPRGVLRRHRGGAMALSLYLDTSASGSRARRADQRSVIRQFQCNKSK